MNQDRNNRNSHGAGSAPHQSVTVLITRSLVLTVGLVGLMTYIVMPRMTRLFSWWLYA